MSTPRITVLINAYNYGRYVGEAIESVLAQDFPAPELEILVVDDGSTDNTREVVARYGDSVRYIYKPNGGQASALNVGFQNSRGEILALLDGDDLFLPGKLRRVVEEFDRHPEAGMVCHPYRIWDMHNGAFWDAPGFHAFEGLVTESLNRVLRYGNFGTCGMALRISAARKLFPIPETLRLYADTYLVIVAAFTGPVVGIDEHLTKYRHHGGNSTAFAHGDAGRIQQRWEYFRRGIEEAKHWLREKGYDLGDHRIAAYLERFQLCARMFHFQWQPPTRREYYRYLSDQIRLYAPIWSIRYRAFRRLVSLTSLLLGYRFSEAMRNSYRNSAAWLSLRDTFFPTEKSPWQAKGTHASP